MPETTKRKRCVTCGKEAPEVEGAMITSRGWRFSQRRVGDATVLDLRCPACFEAYRPRLRDESIKPTKVG